MISINRKLNLVIPIRRDDGTVLYVHSMPIRPETFETYFLPLSKTWAALSQHGLDPRSGPSVALLMLKKVSQDTMRVHGINWWEGDDGVGGASGLLAEVARLSNAIVPADGKWDVKPLQEVADAKIIDEEERKEVMNALVFFTAVCHVAPKVDRERLIKGMAAIYELLTTSSAPTEFATSLMISTTDENTGENNQA